MTKSISDGSENALKLDLYSLADTQELEEVIGCCEGKHIQQVVYSTYHKGMTRVCFGCMQVDTTIDLNKIEQKPPTKLAEQILNEPAPHKEWLKPSEIAERNLIVNSKGKGDYRYILRLIKSGKLPARNWAEQGEKPYWLVSYFEIMKYNEMLRQGVI